MKSYALVDAGLTGEDRIPAFKFEVEMRDGEDFDGKFQIQFAAVEQDGEKRFAVNSPQGILAVFDSEASLEFAKRLAEEGKYVILANYENRAWEDPYTGTISMPLMGRELGKDIDYQEEYELDAREYDAVKQISDILHGNETNTLS